MVPFVRRMQKGFFSRTSAVLYIVLAVKPIQDRNFNRKRRQLVG